MIQIMHFRPTLPVRALILLILCCCLALPMAACYDNSTAASVINPTQPSESDGNESFQADAANQTQEAGAFLLDGSWQRIIDLPRSINSFAIDPGHPNVIYAGAGNQGSGSGVYKSEDGGLTWNLSMQGLPVEDVSALAANLAGEEIYAASGVRGDIYASTDGGKNWALRGNTDFFGGFSSRMVADPNEDNTHYMISVSGGLAKSSSAGRSWQHISEGLPHDQDDRTGAYVLSLAVDPTNSSIVYAGTGGFVGQGHGVYKSRNGGLTWSAANRGMLDYRISALAVDPLNPQTVYAGSDGGELFKSTDGGESWRNVANRDLFEQNNENPGVRAIALDPASPELVYVLLNFIGVLASGDGGGNWTVLGKPESLESPMFTALAMTFDPQPVILVGVDPNIDDAGGWRYSL